MEVDIDVTLRHDELITLLSEAAPLRIHLTEGDEDRRYVELETPSEVMFVAGRGLRIVTRGRLRHELGGLGLPFDIRRVQVLFAPEIVSAQHGLRLDFRLQVEAADLENVPGVVESVVVSRVNQALEPERLRMYWELAQTLSTSVPLPARFEPLDRFLTSARSAQMTVTNESLILRLSLGLSLTRSRARPSDERNPAVQGAEVLQSPSEPVPRSP
jgi:hypothetical protein